MSPEAICQMAAVAGRLSVFDCAGVGSINSIGIRQWILFVSTLSTTHDLTFRNCPMSLMEFGAMLVWFMAPIKNWVDKMAWYCGSVSLG